MSPRPRIATLEAFIIDTFTRVEDGTEVPMNKPDQIGGAGTYAIIGARIFLPASRLAMVVDYTPSTLPDDMRATLASFGQDMFRLRVREDGQGTTRAVNRYEGETRGFEYLTPPRLIYPSDILGAFPPPAWVHLVSFPERALRCLDEIRAQPGWTPGFLWEPEPPACIPENLDVIAHIASQVDIISPNHTEAMTLFRAAHPTTTQLRSTIEWTARRLVALRPRVGAVVRAGALGACYVLTSELPAGSLTDVHLPVPPCVPVHWVPAYWTPGADGYEGAVVDPTGAGNAFMGGLMAALDEGKGIDEACIHANVAASFIIEQDGLPRLATINGAEVWNGAYPRDRVRELVARMEGVDHTSGGLEKEGARVARVRAWGRE